MPESKIFLLLSPSPHREFDTDVKQAALTTLARVVKGGCYHHFTADAHDELIFSFLEL